MPPAQPWSPFLAPQAARWHAEITVRGEGRDTNQSSVFSVPGGEGTVISHQYSVIRIALIGRGQWGRLLLILAGWSETIIQLSERGSRRFAGQTQAGIGLSSSS